MVPHVPAAAVAFPAFWLFLLGFILSLGIVRMRRARHDLRDDWNRLVRFNDALLRCVASRGTNEPARIELIALARALDEQVEPPPGRPGLAAQAEAFDPQRHPGGLSGNATNALEAALRQDVLAVDRELQARMKRSERAAGNPGRVFVAGAGAILLLPLEAVRKFGFVQRLTARHVEDSLWFHAAVGVVMFVLLAGSALAALQFGRVLWRLAGDLGLLA